MLQFKGLKHVLGMWQMEDHHWEQSINTIRSSFWAPPGISPPKKDNNIQPFPIPSQSSLGPWKAECGGRQTSLQPLRYVLSPPTIFTPCIPNPKLKVQSYSIPMLTTWVSVFIMLIIKKKIFVRYKKVSFRLFCFWKAHTQQCLGLCPGCAQRWLPAVL